MTNKAEILIEVKTKFGELKQLRNELTSLKEAFTAKGMGDTKVYENLFNVSQKISNELKNIGKTLSNIKPGTDLDKIKNKFDNITSSVGKLLNKLASVKSNLGQESPISSISQNKMLQESKLTSGYLPSMTRIHGNLVSSTMPKEIASDYKSYYSGLEKEAQKLPKAFDYAAWREDTKKTIDFNKDKLNQLREGLKTLNKEGGENIRGYTNKLKNEIKSTEAILAGHGRGWKAMADGIVGNMSNMIKMQAMWYSSKFLVFLPVEKIAQSAKVFVEWQQGMKDVQAASFATAVEMERIKKASIEIGENTPVAAEKAAKAMFEFAQAGVDVTTIEKASMVAAKLVTITHEEMADAVTALTKIYSVYKEDAKDMVVVGDKIAASMADSRLKIKDLSIVFNYLAATGNLAKVSLTDLLTVSTALSKAGAEPSTIGTGMSTMMAQLINPSKKLIRALKPKLEQAGYSMADIIMPENDIITIIKRLDEAGIGVKELLGGLQMRAGRSAASLMTLSSEIDKIKENIETKGKLGSMFDISMEGIDNKLKIIGNNFNNTFIKLGDISTGFISTVLNNFNQIVLAISLSAGSTAEASEKFEKLNTVGKITYSLFTSIGSVFSGIEVAVKGLNIALLPITGTLKVVNSAFGESNTAIKIFTSLITTGLIAALLSKIRWLGTSITVFSELATVIRTATTVVAGFTGVLGKLWGMASTKVFSVLVLFEVAGWIQDWNKKDLNKLQEEAQKGYPLSSRKTKSSVQGNIKSIEENITQDEEIAKDYRSGKMPIPSSENAWDKLVKTIAAPFYNEKIAKTLDKKIEVGKTQLKQERENLEKIIAEEAKKPYTPTPDQDTTKRGQGMGREWSLEKEEANTALKVIDNLEKEAFSNLEKRRRFGEISDDTYYNDKIKLVREYSSQRQIIELEVEGFVEKELAVIRDRDLAKEKITQEEKDRINKNYNNKVALVAANKVGIERKAVELINKAEEEQLTHSREQLIKNSNYEIEKIASVEKTKLDLKESALGRESELRNWLYEKNLLSAKYYFAREVEEIKTNGEIKKALAVEELKAEVNKQNAIYFAKGSTVAQQEDAQRTMSKAFVDYNQKEIKIADETATKIQTLEIKKADSIKAIYAGPDGITNTIKKAFQDLSTEWDNVGQHIYDATKNITTGMENAFGDFFDYMSDSFMDFENLAKNVLHTIYMEMLKTILLKQIMGGLFGSNGGIGGIIGSLFSSPATASTAAGSTAGFASTFSYLPMMATGGSVSLNKAYIVGEKGPELFTPNSSGNITPNNMLGGQPNMMVNINVENQTGQQVAMSTKGMRFDGEKYIVEAILKNYDSYGPIYHMFQKGR